VVSMNSDSFLLVYLPTFMERNNKNNEMDRRQRLSLLGISPWASSWKYRYVGCFLLHEGMPLSYYPSEPFSSSTTINYSNFM
jgi:hypothetical protein